MRYCSSVTHLQYNTTVFPYQLLITFIQCDKKSIAEALNSPLPFNDPLDGLLIYHRRVGNSQLFPDRDYFIYFCKRFTTCLVRHHLWVGSRGTWCPSCWGSRWTGFLHRCSTFHSPQVCQELQEQQPAEYGGMKTYLKKTYDRWFERSILLNSSCYSGWTGWRKQSWRKPRLSRRFVCWDFSCCILSNMLMLNLAFSIHIYRRLWSSPTAISSKLKSNLRMDRIPRLFSF